MSDNKLLAENTIRRFMQLANVETMTDNFISENYKEDLDEEVEDTNEEINEEEEVELEENFEDLDEAEEDDMAAEEEELDTPVEEPELDAAGEPGAADISLTEEEAALLVALGERISAAMPGAPGEEEGLADMGDDMEMDMGGMDDPVGDEEEAAAYRPAMNEQDQEDLVNEVLKRVTKRLVAAKLKNRK